MAIFDNELVGNVSDRSGETAPQLLPSPSQVEINPFVASTGGIGGFGDPSQDNNNTGKSLADLANTYEEKGEMTVDSPFESFTRKELLDNKRYNLYERNKDLENIYSLQQSWIDQLANGGAKFALTAAGTFAQGFSAIPKTIRAIKNGSFSDLSNPDGWDASIDTWLKNMEDVLPNYISRYERNNPLIGAIPFFRGSANFWGDGILRNLGFTVGAIGNAVVTDLAIGTITAGTGLGPLIASQVGRMALRFNKVAGGASQADRVLDMAQALGKSQQTLLNLERLGAASAGVKILSGPRYITMSYGAALTEAGVESRALYNSVREELINQYKASHLGEEPIGADLDEIEKFSTDAMNTGLGINMALLTLSNTVQFGSLMKSFIKSSSAIKELDNIALKKGSLNAFEVVSPTKGQKIWNTVLPPLKNIVAEGVYEEGGQFATEKGAFDYYTRKYRTPQYKENWNTIDETINSVVTGFEEQFGSDEGLKNMLMGAITSLISGGVSGVIARRGQPDKNTRLNSTVNMLNSVGLTSTLNEQYQNTGNSVNIAKEMEEAARTGDVYAYNNLKGDMFFNFVMARIPHGLHDVTVEQLSMLKDLPKEEFEKTFGMDFNSESQKTVADYVNSLISEANSLKNTYDSIDRTFTNPFKFIPGSTLEEDIRETRKHQVFNEWKVNLAYYGNQSKFVNKQKNDIQSQVSEINSNVDINLLSDLTTDTSLKELASEYEAEAVSLNKTISTSTTPSDRRLVKNRVKALRTLSEKINSGLKEGKLGGNLFNSLLNFELNAHDPDAAKVVGGEHTNALFNYGVDVSRLNERIKKAETIFDALASESGLEGFVNRFSEEQPTQEAVVVDEKGNLTKAPIVEMVGGEKGPLEIGRKYTLDVERKASYSKLEDGRWEISSPDGTKAYASTEESAQDIVNELDEEFANLAEITILEFNPDGTIKVEDKNGDILNISQGIIQGYAKTLTPQELLQNQKNDLDKQQKELTEESGTTNTPEITGEEDNKPEGRLKSADTLFTSTTSASEDRDAENLRPHIKRAITFKNNVKDMSNRANLRVILVTSNQEKSLGLEGLSALSLETTGLPKDKYTDINTGLIAAVYVEQDTINNKVYFVDQQGKRLSEVGTPLEDMANTVVFDTMPTTHTVDKDGTPKYRAKEKAIAIEYSRRWESKRKQLFALPEGQYEIFEFSISRGIPRILDSTQRNPVKDILVLENKISTQEGLIVVPTTGYISHLGENISFPNGIPVLKYGDTLQVLNNSKLNKNQIDTVFEILKNISNQAQESSAQQSKFTLNKKYIKFLQNLLYYYNTAKFSKNQFFIDTKTMELRLGANKWDLTKLGDFESDIKTALADAFTNVNNFTLTKKFNDKFYEIYLGDNNTLQERVWKNYQTYLLSSSYPDGSVRPVSNIPLFTNIDKPTEAVPFVFKQKYAILEAMELPMVSTPQKKTETKTKKRPPSPPHITSEEPAKTKTKQKQETPKSTVSGVVLDGETKNISKFSKTGPIEYTAKYNAEGELEVTISPEDPTIVKLSETPAAQLAIESILRASDNFTEEASPIERTKTYAAFMIGTEIKSILLQQQEKTEPPKTQTTEAGLEEEGQPTTESKKAKKNFSNVRRNNPQYSRIGREDVPRLTDEDIRIFEAWREESLPNIPAQIANRILYINSTERAWGKWENNLITFYERATKGTPYHEAFEAVWTSFLSPEEQAEVLGEFRNRRGTFLDIESGTRINYDEATDQQAKERIADEFGEFRLGKIKAQSVGSNWLVKLYRWIIDLYKFIRGDRRKPKSSIKTLFEDIDAGRFKAYELPEIPDNAQAQYKKVGDLTEQQTRLFVEDMVVAIRQMVMPNKENLYNPLKLTAQEIFSKIREDYVEEGVIDNEDPTKLTDFEFQGLVSRTKDYLRTLNIEFDENNEITINDDNRDNREYTAAEFTTDWKKSSPFAIKFLLSGLVKTKESTASANGTLAMPEADTNNITGGYSIINFSKAFAQLLERLGNTTDPSLIVEKLKVLAKENSEYVRLFAGLGGNLENGQFKFDQFDAYDWKLFINFYQVFSKQSPEALIQYIEGGEYYFRPANTFTGVKQIKDKWLENVRTLSRDKDSIIGYNAKNKEYVIDKKQLAQIPIRKSEQMISFLGSIGFEISTNDYSKLDDKEKFASLVAAIKSKLSKSSEIASVTGRSLNINSELTSLAEMLYKVNNPNTDITYFDGDGNRRQLYENNNAYSVFVNDFNSSQTLDDLLSKRPELKDVFSENSLILKKGGQFFDKDGNRIKTLKNVYIQSTKNLDSGRNFNSSSLSLRDRFIQEINLNLSGSYYILIPADSSTERAMELSNMIGFQDVVDGSAWNTIYSVFRNYLIDDIRLALDSENRKYRNAVGRTKELRFFKDILSPKLLEQFNGMINRKDIIPNIEDFRKWVGENEKDINGSIKAYLDNRVSELRSTLERNRAIIPITFNEETGDILNYSWGSLLDKFSNSNDINRWDLTTTELNHILTYQQVNYTIANIEFHKIIFGDPHQFALKRGNLDETKRIKSFGSPRNKTFDTPQFNTFLNQTYNAVGGIELEEGELGFHTHKSYTNTVTFTDVTVGNKELSKINPTYGEINEADAASWVIDNTYREIKIKNAQWSEEAEKFHQWQMAYARQNIPGYKYKNPKLKEKDIALLKTPEPVFRVEVLKPIVTGVKYNSNIVDNVLDKFSQMPLYYKAVQGTNLEHLYLKMHREEIGYGIFISGRKVGADELYPLYKENGAVNTDEFSNIIPVSWNSYGIQQENSYDRPKEQTMGTQTNKLASIDLFDKGAAISEQALELYQQSQFTLNQLQQYGYALLLEKLGIEDLGNSFALSDPAKVSEALEHELLRRQAPENLKDTIRVDPATGEFIIPFESSASYIQIKDILYSMVDKAIVHPKVSGGSHVQVPSTMWEKSGKGRDVVTINGKKIYTSSELKFYTKEEPYMEILLPNWFRNKIKNNPRYKTDEDIINYLNSTEEGKQILSGIGFRIPTQALSSIENVKVKGFLPDFMGNTVVVPSEITTKAGSDFDIDKLNMYLKSIYLDDKGQIRLVKYFGSIEETQKYYRDLFDKMVPKKIQKYSELYEALQLLAEGKEFAQQFDSKGLIEKYAEVLNNIVEEIGIEGGDLYTKAEEFIKKVENYSNEEIKAALRKEYIDGMVKRALENEYFSQIEKLITLPENFERLITPVGKANLDVLAKTLDNLKGYDESNIPNRILNMSYMTSLRHAFLLGKKWVGIGAVNITGHALAQKSEIIIDPERFSLVSEYDQKFLGDGTIVLPHNTNSKGKATLSGTKTADGKNEYISDRLSGYITSFVDVANDPYILKVIKSDLVVGTFMFLERIGAGENAALFMNQPIIERYLEYLDSINSRSLFSKKNIEEVLQKFPTTAQASENAEIKVSQFSNNIKSYWENGGKFTNSMDNVVQEKILWEFLKYAKMAEYLFKFSQAYSYDNTKFRSADAIFLKNTRTDEAREKNIITSVDNILNNSYIGQQARLLSSMSEATGSILKLDSPEFRGYINDVLFEYANTAFLPRDEYDKIGNKVVTGFLDFIVQTKSQNNFKIKQLFVETSTSVASKLARAKKKYPDVQILHELEIISSPKDENTKSIGLRNALKSSYDVDLYTDMFRELKETARSLYDDIVSLSILQGTYQTAINISQYIPVEDRAAVIGTILKTIKADDSLKAFSKGAFHRANWKDDKIVPTHTPRIFPKRVSGIEVVTSMDEAGEDIMLYNTAKIFPNIPNLGIKPVDRKILLVSELYNSNVLQHDFIKVPRLVSQPGGNKVDLLTGKNITKLHQRKKRAKGDMSIYDVFGYQRVKYEDGTPVVYYDKEGNAHHVYKLINLWGDGQYVAEYYNTFRPSVLNNGTIKIDKEILDRDIIDHFGEDLGDENSNVSEANILPNMIANTNIEIITYKYTRESVAKDSNSMYIFTDNAERTSNPTATSENINKDGWYYQKYKSKTTKPIHYGSASNPTSAVIRGLNNAYPISTMSAYGTNWTNENLELFKEIITDEIAQIKEDIAKFNTLKIGNFRIGQGGLKAKLPQIHQQFLDQKLLEIGIDNSKTKPKITNPTKETGTLSEEQAHTLGWKRRDANGYEVSTKGDTRFSAFNAKIRRFNNRSIEEIYQTDIKGYKTIKEGKGKPPKVKISRESLYNKYKELWNIWVIENPQLIEDLSEKSKGKYLTDMFANTDINQARVLSEILNEKYSVHNTPTSLDNTGQLGLFGTDILPECS